MVTLLLIAFGLLAKFKDPKTLPYMERLGHTAAYSNLCVRVCVAACHTDGLDLL